jgi:uncharacterized protein YqeY
MTLYERLYEDMKLAMKAHEEVKLNVIRMAIAACKNYRIEKYGVSEQALSDEEVLLVLSKQLKQRKDSASSYVSAERHDLAEKENNEASMIQEYLPPLMSDDDLKQIISDTKTELGVTDQSGMGKLIGAVMQKVKGKADGNVVQKMVKESF